jgi:hypothetical protein
MFLPGCNLPITGQTRGNSLSKQKIRILTVCGLRRPLAAEPQLPTTVARPGSQPDGRLV